MSAAKLEKAVKADTSTAKVEKVAKAPKVKKAKVVAIKDAAKKVASPEKLINTLLAPHITEKTSLAMQNSNQYTFRVKRNATKTDIKQAVELMFEGVKVKGVQIVNEPGKTRRFGRLVGRTQDWKKAYVSLVQGQTIDYEARAKA